MQILQNKKKQNSNYLKEVKTHEKQMIKTEKKYLNVKF